MMSKRILVVDDEPKIASALAVLLRSVGYEVNVQPGGAAAIAQLPAFLPIMAWKIRTEKTTTLR